MKVQDEGARKLFPQEGRVCQWETAQQGLTLRASVGRNSPSRESEVTLLTDSQSVVCRALELQSEPSSLLKKHISVCSYVTKVQQWHHPLSRRASPQRCLRSFDAHNLIQDNLPRWALSVVSPFSVPCRAIFLILQWLLGPTIITSQEKLCHFKEEFEVTCSWCDCRLKKLPHQWVLPEECEL